MTGSARLIVFTDLDGTLLDHETYGHGPADPVIAQMRRLNVPLILASSKTAAEMAQLHAELELGAWPGIVENGAGLFEPGQTDPDQSVYHRIRAALARLPAALRDPFQGFGDVSDDEVATLTGLPLDKAALARHRCFSEPGLWSGDADSRAAFEQALAEQNVHARQGGRFLTLSLGGSKADRMAEIAQRFGAETRVALGDAPNDAEMLSAADLGVIVRNDHGPDLPILPGEAEGRIRRTPKPGPEGWAEAMRAILTECGYKE